MYIINFQKKPAGRDVNSEAVQESAMQEKKLKNWEDFEKEINELFLYVKNLQAKVKTSVL